MPDVSAPESAGTVIGIGQNQGQQQPRRSVGENPDQERHRGGSEHDGRDGAMAAEPQREFVAENAGGHRQQREHAR